VKVDGELCKTSPASGSGENLVLDTSWAKDPSYLLSDAQEVTVLVYVVRKKSGLLEKDES